MTVRQHAFQVNRLTWVQRGPLFNLSFQRAFPTKVTKVTSDVLSDEFQEFFANRRASGR